MLYLKTVLHIIQTLFKIDIQYINFEHLTPAYFQRQIIFSRKLFEVDDVSSGITGLTFDVYLYCLNMVICSIFNKFS